MPEFIPEGGHVYALREDGGDGFQKTILSVELERGKTPWVIDPGYRQMTREETEALMSTVVQVYGR